MRDCAGVHVVVFAAWRVAVRTVAVDVAVVVVVEDQVLGVLSSFVGCLDCLY